MTPVGHSLMGLAIGWIAVPAEFSRRAKIVALAAFVALANAPDWPLPGWGHDRYDISHSIFVTLGAITVVAAIATTWLRQTRYFSWRLIVGGAAAWLSHLLLDTFYFGRRGLAMFWPMSEARVSLPLPWFTVMQLKPLVSAHNARVFAIEAAFYGAILAAVIVWRWRRERGRRAL
ncbi:metal-dependent hydrolase [Lacipirellula parvula]|uniref:Metal-dependent hydrolase n=1 Tax=Lacipirellula parvula TaxID=2650471 RepID=A0A5K7XFI8_9BACT|nr:metal-dependent hydrolase [Lacipirellula parvula]BBO35278.1 hypothetical protein PLANPX_4890 [Lacipirellula parvula]